jgi:hypothetical protein
MLLALLVSSGLGACTFTDPIIHAQDGMGGDGAGIGGSCFGGSCGLGGQTVCNFEGCGLGGGPGIGGEPGGIGGAPGCSPPFSCGLGGQGMGMGGEAGLGGAPGCNSPFGCGLGGETGQGGQGQGGQGQGGQGQGGQGQGGQGQGGAPGFGCSQITSLSECEDRTDCYSVYFDPGNCNCAFPGCCAQFHHCADGFAAVCGGPVTCALVPPHCESPYVISRRGGCFEGCVFYGDCSP